MATVNESANATSQGNPDLAGVYQLSRQQPVTFTRYQRWVLPLDGYVFWLRTETQTVTGSLHSTIDNRQNEDETVAVNRMTFMTGTPIDFFNRQSINEIWIASFEDVKFSFSSRGAYYLASGVYHYVGTAVYPALLSQLVDVGDQFPKTELIVSNSLPLWLMLVAYSPEWLVPPNPCITLYPSYLVPTNLHPPYGVVHIDPASTVSLQAVPNLGPTSPIGWARSGTVNGTTLDSTHWQLVSDRVRITLYGETNQQALDWLDLVNSYSRDQDLLGIMSVSPMRDEKRTQAEINVIAMKKTVEYQVSYYQNRVNTAARSLIETAAATIYPMETLYAPESD
jgi:hypothetical protein